jgi:hypothetical protein
MQLARTAGLVLVTVVVVVMASLLLYERAYPRFDIDYVFDLESVSCQVRRPYWPERSQHVSVLVTSPDVPVDVYLLRVDNRREQEIANTVGRIALNTGQPPPDLFVAEQHIQSRRLSFSKPENQFFQVLVVNPSGKPARVKVELSGQ